MNEQSYLNHTLTSLRAAYERLNANITEKDANYKDLQEYMIDYKAELDKFEVYDYQQTLSMIDKQGFRQVMEREQVTRYSALKIKTLNLMMSIRICTCSST